MKSDFLKTAILGLLLSGCQVGPVYQVPEMDIPCNWQSETPSDLNTEFVQDGPWWEHLQDPVLNELMNYAAHQNLDLKIAGIRVLQARAELKGKQGERYPRIDGSASYDHVYYNKNVLKNALFGTSLSEKSKHAERNLNLYEIGFDAEWEIDFFGLQAHEIAAMQAHAEATQSTFNGLWVTLSAEIAKNYIELRTFQRRLHILNRSIETYANEVELTQELLQRGLVSESHDYLIKAELSTREAERPQLELNIARTIHRLSILLGYPPGDLKECLCQAAPLPIIPENISIGIPSELLRRRPDIRKVERELAAATERVGSAIAALFPRFSLRGFVGDISTHTGSLFSPSSATWFAGPLILVPIFNSRLLLQEVEYNKMMTQEALYNYQKTVLEALEETENAIASFKFEKSRFFSLIEAHKNIQTAFGLENGLYQKGVTDKFGMLKTQKSLLLTEEMVIQSQSQLLLDYIALLKAIGGNLEECNN